jgi:hypothetical protein
MSLSRAQIYLWDDVSDEFELLEDQLVYHDAPLEGFLRARAGELFAFRTQTIIDGHLWHWVLLPVASVEAPISRTFAAARQTPPDLWISIVEDRRGDEARVVIARLRGGIHHLPPRVLSG